MKLPTQPTLIVSSNPAFIRAVRKLGVPADVPVIPNPTADDVRGQAVLGSISHQLLKHAKCAIEPEADTIRPSLSAEEAIDHIHGWKIFVALDCGLLVLCFSRTASSVYFSLYR